jgi:hypothetical protein
MFIYFYLKWFGQPNTISSRAGSIHTPNMTVLHVLSLSHGSLHLLCELGQVAQATNLALRLAALIYAKTYWRMPIPEICLHRSTVNPPLRNRSAGHPVYLEEAAASATCMQETAGEGREERVWVSLFSRNKKNVITHKPKIQIKFRLHH